MLSHEHALHREFLRKQLKEMHAAIPLAEDMALGYALALEELETRMGIACEKHGVTEKDTLEEANHDTY